MLPQTIFPTSRSHVTASAIKLGAETILNGRKKLDLDLFPRQWRGLNEFFNAIYRGLIGIDARAEQLIRSQKSQILKAMLKASLCETTQVVSFGDPDSAHQTSFGICRKGENQVCFFQFVSGSKTQIADIEMMEIDSEKFKTDCLRAYIQSEHEAGCVAELSDINLREIELDDIQFESTKITCDSLKYLAEQGRTVSLFGAEVVGKIPIDDMSYLNFRIDKDFALQLINSGADRRMVLHQVLKTAHDSNLKSIDLSGFDIRGLDLVSFDFRHVNFRNALVRPAGKMLSEIEKQHLVLDESILGNTDGWEPIFDQGARELIANHISGNVVLGAVPDFLTDQNQFDEFTLPQFAEFADKIDALNDDGLFLRNLHMENIRLFNGGIHYIDGVTVFEKGHNPDGVVIEHTFYVPIHAFERFTMETFDLDKRAKIMATDYRKLDQYCFFVTMMCVFGLGPKLHLAAFAEEVEKFAEALMPQERIDGEGRKLRVELINFLEKPLEHSLSCSLKTYLTVPDEFPDWYANSYFATGDSAWEGESSLRGNQLADS